MAAFELSFDASPATHTPWHKFIINSCALPGILVLNSREGGPAWQAGIRGTSRDEFGRLVLGDIITAVNGHKVKNSSDLYRELDKCKVGWGRWTPALCIHLYSGTVRT